MCPWQKSGAFRILIPRSDYRAESSTASLSGVTAGRDVAAGNDISITAARGDSSGGSKSFEAGAFGGIGAEIGFPNGIGAGYRVEASIAGAKAVAENTGYSNAGLSAGEGFIMRSGRDATVAGANIDAKNVVLDVGRDFTLASVQDSGSSHSSSYKIGGAVTWGAGAAGDVKGALSLDLGWGSGHSNLVGAQTSILGQESLAARVGERTHIKGAVLAAGGDNLLLDTGTLSFEDIHAKQTSKEFKTGLSGAVNFSEMGRDSGGTKNGKQETTPQNRGQKSDSEGPGAEQQKSAEQSGGKGEKGELPESGSGNTDQTKTGAGNKGVVDTILDSPVRPKNVDYSDSATSQTLHATVGQGTIIVRDDPDMPLDGLNRDPAKSMEVKTSETKLHVGPVLDDVKAVKDLFGVPKTIDEYTGRGFTAKDGQVQDITKLLTDPKSAIPAEVRGELEKEFKRIDLEYKNKSLSYDEMRNEKINVIEKYQGELWMPEPIRTDDKEGYGVKME